MRMTRTKGRKMNTAGERERERGRERGRGREREGGRGEKGRESRDTEVKEIKLLVVGDKGIRDKERY